MGEGVRLRGGALVGWVRASWPFATLAIERGVLRLRLFDVHEFSPEEVLAIEPVRIGLFLSLRIHHTRTDCPEKVLFQAFGGGTNGLLDAARAAGFAVGPAPARAARGSPVNFSALLAYALAWNALFLLDWMDQRTDARTNVEIGDFGWLALGLTFVLCTCLLRSKALQSWLLKEGRDFGEVKGAVRLAQIVSGAMWLASTLSSLFWPG